MLLGCFVVVVVFLGEGGWGESHPEIIAPEACQVDTRKFITVLPALIADEKKVEMHEITLLLWALCCAWPRISQPLEPPQRADIVNPHHGSLHSAPCRAEL